MTDQQIRKGHIRAFMQAHYTDERLAQLLCHAKDGKLAYNSCCCFIGIPTANHPLQPAYKQQLEDVGGFVCGTIHSRWSRLHLMGAAMAEKAFQNIGFGDESMRRILIPMVRAEMKRRELLRQPAAVESTEAVEVTR